MQCSKPMYALNLGKNSEGKTKLKFLGRPDDSVRSIEERYGADNIVPIPCGNCLACKLNYAKNWALRCCLEAEEYEYNWFVTITYDDEHIPFDHKVHKEDLQKYLKRVRKKYGEGVRFFGAAEYGELTHRPHYHLILFNLPLPDIKCLGKAFKGYMYESKELSSCWKNGYTSIGDVSYSSCNYVARYCLKKYDDPDTFLLMSRRPGLAYNYFQKHKEDIYENDCIYYNFGNTLTARPSRYFDTLYSKIMPEQFENIKTERLSKANQLFTAQVLAFGSEFKEKVKLNQGEVLARKVKGIKKRRI